MADIKPVDGLSQPHEYNQIKQGALKHLNPEQNLFRKSEGKLDNEVTVNPDLPSHGWLASNFSKIQAG